MEKKNEIVICKTEKDPQGGNFLKCGENDFKLEKKDIEPKVKVEIKKENNNDNYTSNKVLKRKVTEDGVVIERVLSEGEASSGFETVSSVDSKMDIDELDLSLSSSIDDRDDFNIIVKVKNDLAFQNKNRQSERKSYSDIMNKSSNLRNHRSDNLSNDYSSRRQNSFDGSKESKYQRNNVDKNYKYDRKDRESSERKNFDNSRQRNSNNDWSSYRDSGRRLRSGRQRDSEGRSRRSSRQRDSEGRSRRSSRQRDSEGRSRRSRSRSTERYGRYRRSRSSDRVVRNRSPKYKGSKTESKSTRSYDRHSITSSPERSSPPRKKRRDSFSKSSSSGVWRRLESRKSPVKTKKEDGDKKSQKKSFDSPPRKKERTPFLVELERKLKEVERSKTVKNEPTETTDCAKRDESSLTSTLPPTLNNSNPNMTNFHGIVHTMPYTTMPALSIENLPLVPGPTGLPVHITSTGEQIPHDMDGRPIPLGPNGYYLPVDPTGRVFPHIVSPENLAVPIHMTEDGVLRLPNSEPVPYGPQHQLPVNIDGRVIPIGPDSKPLYPCPNLPQRAPINLMQRMNCNEGAQIAEPLPPQPQQQPEVKEIVQTRTTETQTDNQVTIQPPVIDLGLLNLIQGSAEEINKADFLNKYKKKVQEKSENVLKCIEVEKTLGVNPSKRGVKRSIPMKLSLKKMTKDEGGSSGSDMVLDSGDSGDSPVKSVTEPNKGPDEEILTNSDDEKGALKIICDKEVPKVPNSETKFEDYITEKVQRAIKFINEKKNQSPPAVGRFIISDFNLIPIVFNSSNESPLFRDRIQLPFLTPNIPLNAQPITIKDSEVNFKFVSQKKNSQKVDPQQKKPNPRIPPVFTFDFAMQCDFTSETIKNLNIKVTKLETEINRLKRVNSNLFDDFRKVQNVKLKKCEELRKALVEIQKKNSEIQLLKRSMGSSK